MAMFKPDASKPIVWNWIHNDLEICPHEIQGAIEHERDCEKTDLTLGFGSTAIGVLSTAVMLGLAGVTFAMVPPVALAVAGALHGYNAGIQGRRRELESEFIADHPDVLKAVESKLDEGQSSSKVASAYESIFRLYRRGDDEGIIKVLGKSESQTIAQPDDNGFVLTDNGGKGLMTRNGITIGFAEDKPIAPSLSNIVSPVWNPAQDLGENPQSALIVGVPGSGKGMLVSNAVRVLKSKYPDLSIFVIDPKADPKERGYWEGISDIYKAFSLMKCSDPDEGAEWLLGCMAQFTAIEGPKLCIFDELMSASTELSLANKELKALSRLKKFVVGLIGQGDSQGAWLWAMTQSPNVSDMGMSGGVRANLRAIGLVSPKNMAAVEALTSTKLIPPPPGGMDELRQLMDASPVNRAVFDGKLARWLPMPKLENYSGFDRDNRKIEREQPIAPPSDDGPYADDIRGTWREDFAKNMPPNIDEAEFLRRYNLEKSLQESSSEIETLAIVDTRPDGLDEYPLIEVVWDYLSRKGAKNLKAITNAMRNSKKVSDDDLRVKLGALNSYQEGIEKIILFGTSKGFIKKVSEDSFEAIGKQ